MTALYWIILALFAVGLYLAARLALGLAENLLGGTVELLRRRLQPLAVRRLSELVQEQVHPAEKVTRLTPRLALSGLSLWRPFWAAVGLLIALLVADRLLSPLVLALSLVGGELYRSAFAARRASRLDDQAGVLIVQMASRYPISRSLASALKEATESLPNGEVRRAVLESAARLEMNQPAGQALRPLQDLHHPALGRLAGLFAIVQDTLPETLANTLTLLQEDVQSRLGLRQQARQSLTTLRGTARVLQGVVAAAMAVAALLPAWRGYFIASPKNWSLYGMMLAAACLGSLYFEAEMRSLEA